MRCRLELLAAIVAGGIGLAGMPLGAAQPPDPLGAIMPYSLLSCGGEPTAIADRLRFVKRESGLSRFVLYGPTHIVRVVGMRTVADYAEMGRTIRRIKDLVAADGIEVGYLMMPTMNCGIRHPFRGYVYRDGRPRDITACPADSAFRADFAAKCAALAREARPAVFMMEDDFHYFGEGCFCDFHRKRFEGMDKDDRHKSLIEDLRLIAEATERAVHAVSPETRIGLCAPRFIPVADTELLAFAFAGPKRPLVRYYGSWYGNDYPIAYAGVLIAAQRAIETLSPKVEYVYESDPVPHSRFYASAARIGMLCSWASAMGYSAPYYWGLGAGEDALRTKDYLHLYARDSSRWAAVRDEAVKGDSVGVRTDGAWYWTMNRLGIPVTMHKAPVELYAGVNAFDALTDSDVTNLLSRAVLLDGAAAEALTARGFSSLIGASAARRENVDFTGESTADGKVRFPCSFHQDFGLDGTPVSRLVPCGAEEVAFMFAGTPTNRVQPSVTCFENRLGGRVGVMATNVGNCQSPNVYSFAKRDCLVRLIARLGGRPLPARVVDRANVALLANVDRGENRLFLHLSNLGCDPLDSVEFELDPMWRNGRVETLDGSVWRESDVRWQGTVVRIPAEAAVFGTLAVRVRKNVDIAPGDIHAKDLCPLDAGGEVAGDPIVVVKDGLARLCIVHAADESARWAADQLRETIFEMTGVRPSVVVERNGQTVTNAPAFYIGETSAARRAGLVAPQDHAEAFRVVTRDGSFYFLGKADFAVTDWCERQLGARFYWPMKPSDMYGGKGTNLVYGKCVVKTCGLAVRPVDWEDRPVYSYRDNYPYEGVAWNRWGKGGRSHRGGVNVHAPHGWWKEPDAQDHLEIFALSEDGKRPTSPLLCYGNPKTVEYYEKRTREGIDAYAACADKRAFKDPSGGILNYAQKVVTISQWDCGVVCACDHCKRLFNERLGASGSGSPIIWGFFTKQYAKWLKANYPDWKICILPYVNTCDVPPDPEDPSRPLSLREEGNVEAMLCTMPGLAMLKNEACRRHEEELIRQWVACTGNPVLNWHYSCWPAEFTSAPFVYGETIRRHYQDMGKDLVGTFINGVYDIERLSLSGYVWMRCLWNPNVDVQAVYDGFATRMFGRAAKPMRKLIAMQETGWNRQWGSDMCSVKNVYEISYPRKEAIEMSALLDEAMELAADDEIAKARIAWYRKGFERFFRESEENASGTAFAPHLMKKAAGMPKIDGRLDDACWQVAEMHEWVSAKCRTNSVPQYKTQSRIVWYPGEEGGVVYGLRFEDPAAGQVREGVQGDTWGQDNCEIFIDASGTGDGHFYQLCIDGSCRLTCYTDGIDWKPQGVKIAKAVGEGFWSLEVFLPFKDVRGFPKARIPTTSADGCVWTGNLCRFRVGDALGKTKAPGSKTEMSRLYTRYNTWNKDPAAFGEFRFGE